MTDLERRFWEKVSVAGTDNCWEWQAYVNHQGYGKFRVNGKTVFAHRFMLEVVCGRDIAPSLESDHLCRNRKCVNPSHIELVTHRENTLRGIGPTARNAARERCRRGHLLEMARVGSRQRFCRPCKNERERRLYRGSA